MEQVGKRFFWDLYVEVCGQKGRKSKQKGWIRISCPGLIFDESDEKTIQQIINKNDHPKTWNLMPKGFQNGTKNDANTHQKSMPTRVAKKIMKIIKNNVSLNGKSIEIRCKNQCFRWFRRLRTRKVKVSKNYQK